MAVSEMNTSILTFDQYVEKVIRKNKLVSDEKMIQARRYILLHPDFNLIHVLLKTKLITQKHSEMIRVKYQEYFQKNKTVQEQDDQPMDLSTVPATDNESPDAGGSNETEKPQHEDFRNSDSDTVEIEDYKTQAPDSEEIPDQAAPESHMVSESVSIPSTLEDFLSLARKEQASDLIINVNSPPIIRKNGHLQPLITHVLESGKTEDLLFRVLSEEQKTQLHRDRVLDTCLDFQNNRYRACFVRQQYGWDATFRIIPSEIPNIEELGLPFELVQLMDYREGLILITGPSGSGKSTSLASFVDMLNKTRNEHIILLEDPVEFIFTSRESHISQRHVGLHTAGYATALRSALREDPDIIVVGELRDKETVTLAVTAAETGHLVFSTLHTTGAAQTIYRLLDLFPPDQRNQIKAQISESIRGIISQRLIPKMDGSGLAIATEILFNISSISNLIREDRIFQIPNMIQINHKHGMRLLDESIQQLLNTHIITGSDAYFNANNKKLFQQFAPQ